MPAIPNGVHLQKSLVTGQLLSPLEARLALWTIPLALLRTKTMTTTKLKTAKITLVSPPGALLLLKLQLLLLKSIINRLIARAV